MGSKCGSLVAQGREGSSRDSELGGERSSAGSEETHGALVFIPVPVTKRLPRTRRSLSLSSKLGSHGGCWICGSVGARTVRAGRGERSCTEDVRRWGQGGGRRSRKAERLQQGGISKARRCQQDQGMPTRQPPGLW